MQQPPQGYGPPPQGYPPQGYGPPPGYPPHGYGPPPKKGLSIWAWLGIITLVGFGGCLGMCAIGMKGVADKAEQEKSDFDKQDVMKVTPAEIASAYEKNEVAGDEKYKGKKIEITGKIDSISSDFSDDPVIHLTGLNAFNNVMLNGIDKATASKLEKGATITAVCKGGGEIVGSPVLNDCKIK